MTMLATTKMATPTLIRVATPLCSEWWAVACRTFPLHLPPKISHPPPSQKDRRSCIFGVYIDVHNVLSPFAHKVRISSFFLSPSWYSQRQYGKNVFVCVYFLEAMTCWSQWFWFENLIYCTLNFVRTVLVQYLPFFQLYLSHSVSLTLCPNSIFVHLLLLFIPYLSLSSPTPQKCPRNSVCPQDSSANTCAYVCRCACVGICVGVCVHVCGMYVHIGERVCVIEIEQRLWVVDGCAGMCSLHTWGAAVAVSEGSRQGFRDVFLITRRVSEFTNAFACEWCRIPETTAIMEFILSRSGKGGWPVIHSTAGERGAKKSVRVGW